MTLRHLIARDRPPLFLCVLGMCAVQAVIIALSQHYGVSWLAPVQPVTAILVPVFTWLAFQSAALRSPIWPRDAWHGIGPLFTGFCIIFAPHALDYVLPMIFCGYGFAIIIALKQESSLPRARLSGGPLPARIWQAIAVFLLLSALSDVLIALAFGLGYGDWRAFIISLLMSFALFGVGLLSLSPHVESISDPNDNEENVTPTKEEADLIARLDTHMREMRPYIDPDLTLSRLARQLHVPIKQLSAAINRHKGENVSRYVNGFRVSEACRCIKEGASVSEAMLASGFNTKSNFNREFLRVTKQTPSAYAAEHARGPITAL